MIPHRGDYVKVRGFLVCLFVLGWAPAGFSYVTVETEKFGLGNLTEREALYRSLDREISAGVWDTARLRFRAGEGFLEVSSANYRSLPEVTRRAVVERLASYYESNDLGSYRVKVDEAKNRLADEPILFLLGIDVAKLTGLIPAEKLLSSYAQKWAYQMSGGYGPNCWHTSMASIFRSWSKPRRMPPKEFACLVKTYFEPIERPSQWGDLIRLADGEEEVHGFTFLGEDSKVKDRFIVFTKNGRMQSRFLFMDLATVRDKVYPGNQVTYFRAKRMAIDPKENPSAPCQFEDDDGWGRDSERDPIIEAGLRLRPTETLPPL